MGIYSILYYITYSTVQYFWQCIAGYTSTKGQTFILFPNNYSALEWCFIFDEVKSATGGFGHLREVEPVSKNLV